jgi:hypothetical protein
LAHRELRPNDIAVHATTKRPRVVILSQHKFRITVTSNLYVSVQHEPIRSVLSGIPHSLDLEAPTTARNVVVLWLLPAALLNRGGEISLHVYPLALTAVRASSTALVLAATEARSSCTRIPFTYSTNVLLSYRTRRTNTPKRTVQHVPEPTECESRRPAGHEPITEWQDG